MMLSRRRLLELAGASSASLFLSHALGGCAAPAPAGPWWTSGNYGPVEGEIDAVDLAVEGSLPPELRGVFLRNGPNPVAGSSSFWFFGDAMLHGVRLEGGRAVWYRNRYIRTLPYTSGASARGDVSLLANYANTALVRHAGRTLALYEGGLPTEITTSDLGTVGEHDFAGALRGPMGAHPKIDPVTGEMVFIGYSPFAPYLTVHHVDAGGALVRSEPITIPGGRMIHDFQLTERNVILFDLPVVFDLEAAETDGFPFRWSPELGARLGVMPRSGGDADVSWIEVDPFYMFHSLNAWDDGDRVVLLGARHDHMWANGPDDETSHPTLHRWTLDAAARTGSVEALDDRLYEFPRIDVRRQGLATRYGYGLGFELGARVDLPKRPNALVKYDLDGGTLDRFDFAVGQQPDEPVLASAGEGEDHGYLLTMVHDAATDSSSVAVFDATDVAGGPIARVAMPRRVPFGFHGDWLADEA